VTYGGDSGNRIFVLYWRCPLIRVFVIRGSTVLYTVCVCVCVIEQAKCMRHYYIVICGLQVVKKLPNIKYVFWFSLQFLSETFLILRKKSARYCHKYENVMSSTRYSRQILMELEFSRQIFKKNTLISNCIKIRPVRAELFHVDGRTWRTQQLFFAILRTRLKNLLTNWNARVT
jgi:hypothetical protein